MGCKHQTLYFPCWMLHRFPRKRMRWEVIGKQNPSPSPSLQRALFECLKNIKPILKNESTWKMLLMGDSWINGEIKLTPSHDPTIATNKHWFRKGFNVGRSGEDGEIGGFHRRDLRLHVHGFAPFLSRREKRAKALIHFFFINQFSKAKEALHQYISKRKP